MKVRLSLGLPHRFKKQGSHGLAEIRASAPLSAGPERLTHGANNASNLSPDCLQVAGMLQASLSTQERLILVASPRGRHESAEFTVQLAKALAELGDEQVLLVDANLGEPSLHRLCDTDRSPGLSEAVLRDGFPGGTMLRDLSPRLVLLPAGTPGHDAGLFASSEFREVLGTLSAGFRFVVIHGSPFADAADSHVIAPRVDGVVIALTPGEHRLSEVVSLKRDLETLKAKVLGVVLCNE